MCRQYYRLPSPAYIQYYLASIFRSAYMKAEIHPEYKTITVNCSCGNSFETNSTFRGESMPIDVCAKCHPFYTGKQKILDTAGQVDKFRRRYGK